jgi:hypothetical protein
MRASIIAGNFRDEPPLFFMRLGILSKNSGAAQQRSLIKTLASGTVALYRQGRVSGWRVAWKLLANVSLINRQTPFTGRK